MPYDVGKIVCCIQGCDRQIAEGHRWGKIRAQDKGWFFAKTGHVYCPDHVPDWVAAWRERRGS